MVRTIQEIPLNQRLRDVRKALGYTQTEIADKIGSRMRSWQEYERGTRVPGSQIIAGLVAIGIDANWVLSGQGNMFLSDGFSSLAQGVSEAGPEGEYHTSGVNGSEGLSDTSLLRTAQLGRAFKESLNSLDGYEQQFAIVTAIWGADIAHLVVKRPKLQG